MFQFYSSFIVGSLLTDAPKNIKTVKQLLNSPFQFGVDVVPYVIDNFHVAGEESTVQLYNKIMKNPEKVLMPLHTGLQLMKQGSIFSFLFINHEWTFMCKVAPSFTSVSTKVVQWFND